ncbi:Uncharacterized membrane protein [Poseidonocella pacifica]|uniref:Uncharacterized membrane protein n=1 Tax=Poseidonocella pacifica TaxID=871651 RepID=A0A1I0YWJ5_9RHOB|nr:NnrU family protein [Poseidonocella pacifica]SFB17755.1 Uncharacterized membrane protein [Poseidonocella pacifica]
MIFLILGILLWSIPHLLRRFAPERRAQMGDKGRGPIALAIILGVVLMVIGYRMADGPYWWGRTSATTGINNLLMLVSVYLFAASGMKTRVTRLIRHPQLTAVILWAIAHLLVNGDLPSFVLFGSLFIWALAEMSLINRSESWTPPSPGPARKEIMALVGTVIVFGVLGGVHYLFGLQVFG